MAKMKNSTKGIIAVIVVLIVIIAVFAGINAKNTNTSVDGLTLTVGDNETVYTIEDLKAMDGIETMNKTIKSGKSADETGDFTGVPLSALLLQNLTEEELKAYSAVVVTSGDGYATSYSVDEVLQPQNVMVIFEKDGEALVPYTDGGSGPIRIVVMNDTFGTRSAMWVTGISLE